MTKYVNGRYASRNNSAKIRCYPGTTTDHIIDYIRLTVCKKPGIITIYTGANDIQNIVKMLQKVRQVITTIKEIDANNEIHVAFSCVINLHDQEFEEEIKKININFENIYI